MAFMLRQSAAKATIGIVVVVVVAVTSTALAWWFLVGVDLTPWLSGPPAHPWASLVRQEERWRAEGLARRVAHQYVPLEAISPELMLAVTVSEDARFLNHWGVDGTALRDALRVWWAGGKLRGASTISQQLARILFLSSERTVARKLREVKLAWWLERELGKRRVLELYLNVVELARGSLGPRRPRGATTEFRRHFWTPVRQPLSLPPCLRQGLITRRRPASAGSGGGGTSRSAHGTQWSCAQG